MELLLAFLIAVGIIEPNTRLAETLDKEQAYELIYKNDLEKKFVVFGQESDDF
jgi:hypothetical protein